MHLAYPGTVFAYPPLFQPPPADTTPAPEEGVDEPVNGAEAEQQGYGEVRHSTQLQFNEK